MLRNKLGKDPSKTATTTTTAVVNKLNNNNNPKIGDNILNKPIVIKQKT